ncbi:cadherin-99C-like [Haliotis rufescens]|uniref:cadherin-99C-like n=1 Tax=Haliotis rufescens TaxID=6454 RepID=UPI00201E90A0|nr:cadherin-99C-like [Haliotis rufescens]XP_048256854.1 cadherin-99C-like [Haliotis rufescens]
MASKLRIYIWMCVVLCATTITEVTSSCSVQPPQKVQVKETDGTGHVIFSINTPSTTKWAFTVREPVSIRTELTSYFSLTSNTTSTTFTINKTLDLEAIYEKWGEQLVFVTFSFTCTENGTPVGGSLERFVTVTPVNEFDPEFINAPFTINVTENTALNQPVFKLKDHAQDRDVNPNQEEIYGFNINPYYNPDLDGRLHFTITQTQTGDIGVAQNLDFEAMTIKHYVLNVSVQDIGKRESFTAMTVNILDADDQDPEFYNEICKPGQCYTSYSASVPDTFVGQIENILPNKIIARDRDTLNYSVSYHLKGTNPSGYDAYFSQNSVTGDVNVTQPLQTVNGNLAQIVLFLQAKEVSVQQRATTTTFQVNIQGRATTTVGTTAKTGALKEEGDNTLMIVLIVLAVIVFVMAVSFLGVVIYLKKHKRPVSPSVSPSVSENMTDVDDLSMDGKDQWPKMTTAQLEALPDKGRGQELPSLKDMGTGTGNEKKNRRRRRKKERMSEEFDGTQEFEGSADAEFFSRKKTRIKQSSRSKEKTDPKYWITVDNDY